VATTAETDTETVTLTATLDQPARETTTVTFAFTDASTAKADDFTVPDPFTATIAKNAKTVDVEVTVVDDDKAEGTETAAFTASAGSLSAAAVSFTITDDDTAGVTVSTDTVTVDEEATDTYTVVLTSQPSGDVVVTATSGTPGKARVSAAVTFSTTNWSSAQSFTITGVEKGTSTVTHAVTGYGTVSTADSVTVTVNTPPPAALTLEASETSTAEADTATVTLTATLDQPARTATTVTFAFAAASAANADDFTVPSPFTAVIAKDAKTVDIDIVVVDDDKAEGTETAAFTASAGSLSAAAVSFTITDNDTAGVTVSTDTVTVDEEATDTYTVVLTSQPSGDVVVTATSGTPANARVSAALTFTSSNWESPQSFTVTGVKKGTSTVTHTVSGYGTVTTAASVTVTVERVAQLVPTRLTISLAQTTATENVGSVMVTGELDYPAGAGGVAVPVVKGVGSTADNDDITMPEPIMIPETQMSATTMLVVRDDRVDENEEVLNLTAQVSGLETIGTSLVIVDDDTAGVAVNGDRLKVVVGGVTTYSVVLESEPTDVVTVTPTSGSAQV
ncbi:MAG: hypothetical protein OXB92_16845, partial [Acidimicrobiaceae bacterium]|nr:hypothetical protein [Acidimicrobiaceae bacterium]